MDRQRTRSGLLIAALLLLAAPALAEGIGGSAPVLKGLRWLAPRADAVRSLSRRPTECLARPARGVDVWSVEVGRAAFRTPVLLGGPAARAGMACETCHRSGRSNPEFYLPGVSGAAGTADVTTSILSTHRGDHLDNPRPIPDLSGPKAHLKTPQSEGSAELVRFIHGLITEEFDGPEPPPAVLEGLAAYVRALDPRACPAAADEPVTAEAAFNDAARALRAGRIALVRQDRATGVAMIAAARAALGDMAERFSGPGPSAVRGNLETAARELADIAAAARQGAPDAAGRLDGWLCRSAILRAEVLRHAPASLYSPKVLAAALRSADVRR